MLASTPPPGPPLHASLQCAPGVSGYPQAALAWASSSQLCSVGRAHRRGRRGLSLPSRLVVQQPLMHFSRQGLNPSTQFLHTLGQHQILLQQRQHLGALLEGEALLLRTRGGEGLTVLDVGLGLGLVAVGLPGLRQQDEWRRIGCLRAEGQVQQNKGIQVKLRHPGHVEADPDGHEERLGDQERGGSKEAREGLGFDTEPVIPENRGEMHVGGMEAERMVRPSGYCGGLLSR